MNTRRTARPGCTCGCHHAVAEIACCECRATRTPCGCGSKPPRRCCGEPDEPRHPEWPPPPGWKPGDRPAGDPFAGAKDDDDRRRIFGQLITSLPLGGFDGSKFGPRKNEFLPFIVMRALAGDHGARPLTTPFWESPDIFVAPNLEAAAAPALPTTRGGLAKAGAPNTLWAQIWNLGLAPVTNARVEFYWFNPCLGFNAAAANLIGATTVTLGTRNSGRARTIVKCPVSWNATFVNGGHECLMVRVFEPLTDPLGPKPWDASDDRHVGQRNISVVNAASPAVIELPLRLGCAVAPGPATLDVVRVPAASVSWLQVLTGERQIKLRDAARTADLVGLLPPSPAGVSRQRIDLTRLTADVGKGILHTRIEYERQCDELETTLLVKVEGLERGECRIYRISQHAEGRLVGGYTVIARRE